MNNDNGSQESQSQVGIQSRRKYHLAAAQWLARWMNPLLALCASIGFFIVLLPVIAKPWRKIIEGFSPTAWIFHEFSALSGVALIPFLVSITMHLILNARVKDFPGGWNPTREWGFPTPRQVVEKKLYPRNSREEFVFWVYIIGGTFGTTALLYLPFAILAFLMRVKTGV